MPIKFTCPHCKRGLSVKEHLAGKRGACPACKKPVLIPAPAGVPEDIEAAAAAALVDQPEPAAVAQEDSRTIDFTCPYCDTPGKFAIAMGGKNAPCPECRRIVKVPMPVKEGPIDWRRADARLPSGAKREELEGAWGSATSAGAVSRQALVEAAAIPEAVEPGSRRRLIMRGVKVAAGLCVVTGIVLVALSMRARSREEKALARALEAVAGDRAAGHEALAGEIHRGAGEFYLRANKAGDAQKHLTEARGLILRLPESSDRDALLIDLALTEIELGGTDTEAVRGTRLKWSDVQKGLNLTLGGVRSPRARLEAVRLVSRRLLAQGQAGIAIAAARNACLGDDLYEATAEVGLQMVQAKKNDEAVVQAEFAQRQFETPLDVVKQEGEKPKAAERRASPPSLIALWFALNKPDRAAKLGADEKVPQKIKITPPDVLTGYVAGLAWQSGKGEEALQLAQKMDPSFARLQAVAALAALAENGSPDAARLIQESISLMEIDSPRALREGAGREVISWFVLRIVRAGAQVGVPREALQRLTVPAVMPDAALRGRAQLELVRAQLKASKAKMEETIADDIDKAVLARGLALEAIARHNANHGQGSLKTIEAWPDESHRPLGYVGLALGIQDK